MPHKQVFYFSVVAKIHKCPRYGIVNLLRICIKGSYCLILLSGITAYFIIKLVFLQPKAGTLYILMLFKLIFFLFCKTPQSIQITSITYPLLLNSSASSLVNHVLLRSSGYLVHIINIFFIFPKFYSVFYSSYTMYI